MMFADNISLDKGKSKMILKSRKANIFTRLLNGVTWNKVEFHMPLTFESQLQTVADWRERFKKKWARMWKLPEFFNNTVKEIKTVIDD